MGRFYDDGAQVFSAQAEVFLFTLSLGVKNNGFLRASGGVSYWAAFCTLTFSFSPRKRRCFRVLS